MAAETRLAQNARMLHESTEHDKASNATDPETAQRYTVERYKSRNAKEVDSWPHEEIILDPFNRDFKQMAITGADGDEVSAELLQVLEG